MSKILKNNTASDVFIPDMGDTVPASGQLTIDPNDYLRYAASVDVGPLIGDSTLTVNDGVDDLDITNGQNFILYSDYAFNVRFAAQPERINGYQKKNVQEAIEETALNAGTSRYAIIFSVNGNISNKWLELFQAVSSDMSPFVVAEVGEIASLSISARVSTTATVHVYVNAISVDTITLTAEQTNYKFDLAHSISPGDRISAKVTSGSAQDPVVSVNVKVL